MLSSCAAVSRSCLLLLAVTAFSLMAPTATRAQEADPDFVPVAEFGNETVDTSILDSRGKLINKKNTLKPEPAITSPTTPAAPLAASVRSLQEASLAAIVREEESTTPATAIAPPASTAAPQANPPAEAKDNDLAPQPKAAPARQAVAAPLQLQSQQKTSYVIAAIPATQALQVGDRVQLDIKNQPDLSGELSINEDGKIDLPLFGPIKIVGQTLAAAQAQITSAYASGYFVSPQIALSYLKPATQE